MLIDYLPDRYRKGPETVEVIQSMDPQAAALASAYHHVLLQLHVATATDGLVLWEKMYGIETDLEKDIEERREQILAKMRGVGVTTVDVVAKVAQSFAPSAKVAVIERYQDYSFVIRFEAKTDVFPQPSKIRKAVEEIKPAHLGMELQYVLSMETKAMLYTAVHSQVGVHIMVTPYTPAKIVVTGPLRTGGFLRIGAKIFVRGKDRWQ